MYDIIDQELLMPFSILVFFADDRLFDAAHLDVWDRTDGVVHMALGKRYINLRLYYIDYIKILFCTLLNLVSAHSKQILKINVQIHQALLWLE